MTDALFSTLEVGSIAEHRTGYRLQRVEVFNWGTFDQVVWSIEPEGSTSLLTGDIGSGKSTLVDAISTLLLPAHRIAYNKAAGADAKERTLRSYVEGHYRSERNETTGSSRPVGLRGHRAYSVILGVFANEGYNETVSIAQVFHQKDRAGQPDRFFVTASTALSIDPDFSDFGTDLKSLRSKLRGFGADIENTFPDYHRRVRRLLGIRSEQAMELFHQTVSMKSVGNLNDFVRDHMLEPVDAAAKVAGIVAHFDDLVGSHDAVQRAGEQIALLAPLVSAADRYDEASARNRARAFERDSVVPYISEQLGALLDEIIAREREDLHRLDAQRGDTSSAREALTPERDRLTLARARIGGDRLRELELEIPQVEETLSERVELRRRYAVLVRSAGLDPVSASDEFRARANDVARVRAELDAESTALQLKSEPLRQRVWQLEAKQKELDLEIKRLSGRPNSLPADLDSVRRRLCAALEIREVDLPFAGELIDVQGEHAEWRGAAERVLRGFALTLLVSQARYADVSRWVNDNRLGAHLIYLRVPDRQVRILNVGDKPGLHLYEILDVEDGRFAEFLDGELARRANHNLVDSVEELTRHDRAVTREGLIRNRDRHEKDDRRSVHDPRSWVLGRGSELQLDALKIELDVTETELGEVSGELKSLEQEDGRSIAGRRESLLRLAEYTAWTPLDSESVERELQSLKQEREELVSGLSELSVIDRQLASLAGREAELNDELEHIDTDRGRVNGNLETHEARRHEVTETLAALGSELLTAASEYYPALDARSREHVTQTVGDCDTLRDRLTRELTSAVEQAQKEMNGYTTGIQQQMHVALQRWPELRSEMDASIQSIGAFRELHDRVFRDDLPRFEQEFRDQLNTNAVRELAQFHSWLRREADEIHTRVARINEALAAIDYSPSRIIVLIPEPTVNQDVRQFRADLRDATADLLASADMDVELRFAQVRALVERFKGRVGHSDADRVWTKRVTDVRNWFTFAASEQDRNTGSEFEHYSDSDGKSGGQKEKLAYTILAASLAYQFGLEWGVTKSRDFRFAVIDEAFGRGSDASTRYALDLFAKLGLQLLVVTPLQKVHIIEPYVDSIGFVDNPSGAGSRVRTLTIEEYRERQAGSGS